MFNLALNPPFCQTAVVRSFLFFKLHFCFNSIVDFLGRFGFLFLRVTLFLLKQFLFLFFLTGFLFFHSVLLFCFLILEEFVVFLCFFHLFLGFLSCRICLWNDCKGLTSEIQLCGLHVLKPTDHQRLQNHIWHLPH